MNTRQSYTAIPKDDAWREVTLSSIAERGISLWIICDGCGRQAYPDPLEFGVLHGLPVGTALLTIGNALKCSACGKRQSKCWPAPPSGYMQR